MGLLKKILPVGLGIGLGFLAGMYTGANKGYELAQPDTAYTKDLNNDGRPDTIVVKNRLGYNTILFQEPNGTYKYKSREELLKQLDGLITMVNSQTRDLNAKIEAKIEEMKQEDLERKTEKK